MYHLLTSGYHFNSSSWAQIRPVKRINEAEVGWGLGHAMMEANTLDRDPTISLALMIGLVTGGLVLLLVGLTMAVKVRGESEDYTEYNGQYCRISPPGTSTPGSGRGSSRA